MAQQLVHPFQTQPTIVDKTRHAHLQARLRGKRSPVQPVPPPLARQPSGVKQFRRISRPAGLALGSSMRKNSSSVATLPVPAHTHYTSTQPLAENKHLLRWVDKMAELTKPDAIHWVDGSQAEYDALCDAAGRERHLHQTQPKDLAWMLLRPLRRPRRRPRRRAHLHLLALQRQRRPDQ